jgi:predicted nuclease of predicted toxin-antitoxin system
MAAVSDPVVWAYAAKEGLVWVRLENCSTADVADLLRSRLADLQAFETDATASFLALS